MRLISLLLVFFSANVFAGYTYYDSGTETVKQIITQYTTVPQNCGNESKPSVLCSGVLIRATSDYSSSFNTWDPSSLQTNKQGVSFSFLRKDVPLYKLAYSHRSGYIFFSPDTYPAGKIDIGIRCAFPTDASTDGRVKACGKYSNIASSDTCENQGVNTGKKWFDKFKDMSETNICGFDIETDATKSDAFNAYIDAVKLMSSYKNNDLGQNELILQNWAKGVGDKLPIKAFFYIVDSTGSGRDSAMKFQEAYAKSTNIWVPVIYSILPKEYDDFAKFYYHPEDQLVEPPVN